MFGCKILASSGSTGLVENRRPLWRRFAEVKPRDLVIFAGMIDTTDFHRIGENTLLSIAPDRIRFPALFPEFIADVHVFVCQVIPIVMPGLFIEAEIFGSAVQVTGNDIPSETAFSQMI